jgi:hypothetical protein
MLYRHLVPIHCSVSLVVVVVGCFPLLCHCFSLQRVSSIVLGTRVSSLTLSVAYNDHGFNAANQHIQHQLSCAHYVAVALPFPAAAYLHAPVFVRIK